MNTDTPSTDRHGLPFLAPCRRLRTTAAFQWLRLGWKDLVAAPRLSLLYGLLIALLGGLLGFLTWKLGLLALYIGLASGFVFVGPFLAMGLYSISYQLQGNNRPTLLFSIQEGRAHLRDTLILGMCLLVLLLVWGRAAMITSVFLPSNAAPNVRDLLPYLGIGTLVGAFFCLMVFCATAFSLPMLLDRRADAITAVITSINATLRNKLAMLIWAAIIGAAVLIGFATALVGFVVLMPLLGFATWHAYRETIDAEAWPSTHSHPDSETRDALQSRATGGN
jgi:uncharacterized membrane protein